MKKIIRATAGIVFFLSSTVSTWAQIPEEQVSQFLYVNNQVAQASDLNPGTAQLR